MIRMMLSLQKVRRTCSMMAGLASLLAVMAAAVTALPTQAAEPWPSAPLKIVVPYTAGGPTDTLSRRLGQHLALRLRQQVLVENRPGAAGGVGSSFVAKSPPDGYTILFGTIGTHAINPHLYKSITYDSLKDFAPITPIVEYVLVLIVDAKSPIRSMADLVAMARKDPQAVTFGSSGVGASNHMIGEILAMRAQATMRHIPYKGDSQALTDLVGGRLTFLMTSLPLALTNEKAGRVRVIATSGRARHPDTPTVPTFAETVPGVDFVGWFGFFAAAGTPKPIVERLASEITAVMAMPEMKASLVGLDLASSSPDAFAQRIRSDYAAWAEIVKRTGVKLD